MSPAKAFKLDQLKNFLFGEEFDSLRNDKILDWPKLKAFTDGKIKFELKIKTFGKGRKHLWKWRKCRFPAFSPFPTMCSKGFSVEVVKSWDCVVKS